MKDEWLGTQIRLRRGSFVIPTEYSVPPWLFEYWNDAADAAHESLAGMSEKQKAVVARTLDARAGAYRSSETFRARCADLGIDPPGRE